MEALNNFISQVNSYLSDYILIILLIGVGLFFTIKTKFVQVRCFGEGMKNVFGKLKLKGDHKKSGLSSFQALATAIAAQVGTGNIVGACGAIFIGGPGAIFWMWVIACLGMATIYAEAVLAQKTKTTDANGEVVGGPVYYIKTAFKNNFGKFLAGFFAVAAVLALGFMGAMVQSNSIATNINGVFKDAFNTELVLFDFFGYPITLATLITGIIVALLSALILIGGTKRLAAVNEKLVPIMAAFYLVGGLLVLAINIVYLPEAFGMIFKYAFVPNAIIGGGIGYAIKLAISKGAQRGLFSNEAGMGSTPHAHALADVKDPHTQGTTAMIGVFIDTFVVLTMTALVVITTLYCRVDAITGPAGEVLGSAIDHEALMLQNAADFSTANMAQYAFSITFAEILPAAVADAIGSVFVAICLFFFAFSTIISWNYFGKVNFEHLFGKKATIIYSVVAVAFVFLGSLLQNDLVWNLTDFFNYLMVIPNVIALFALCRLVYEKPTEMPEIKADANAALEEE